MAQHLQALRYSKIHTMTNCQKASSTKSQSVTDEKLQEQQVVTLCQEVNGCTKPQSVKDEKLEAQHCLYT